MIKKRYNVYWIRKGGIDGCVSIAAQTMEDALKSFNHQYPHLTVRHVELDEKDYTDGDQDLFGSY